MNKNSLFIWLGCLAVLTCLVLSPCPVRAESYVEVYLGGVQGTNNTFNFNLVHQPTAIAIPGVSGELISVDGKLDPAVVGGLKLGTWFVKEGFPGFNYPNWMKYLGFYLDFSFHRLDFYPQNFTTNISYFRTGRAPVAGPTGATKFWSNGDAFTLAFMFAFRYGFFPDTEVPFGRLQPFVAVGPAIVISHQNPTLRAVRSPVFIGGMIVYQEEGKAQASLDLALAAEAGIRYMVLKNVSLNASFKYRYFRPAYEFTAVDAFNFGEGFPGRNTFKLNPTFHLFSFQVGAAYYF